MTRKTEEIFSLNLHWVSNDWVAQRVHLGMPYSTAGTDGRTLATAIRGCLNEFAVTTRVVGYVSDGGANLRTCKTVLDESVSNTAIFSPSQAAFSADCLAHALHNACKKAVVSCSSGTVNVDTARTALQSCITWTKKSSKGAQMLSAAQVHCKLKPRKLLTPVKTRFAYLIHSFRSLLRNREAINYLYGDMPGIPAKIKERKPSWETWAIAEMVVETMRDVVDASKWNQAAMDRWLLSDGVMSLIAVLEGSTSASASTSIELQCCKLRESHGQEDDSVQQFTADLLVVSRMMKARVATTIKPFLDPLFRFVPLKAHVFLCLLLDPRHANMVTFARLHAEPEQAKLLFKQYQDLLVGMLVAVGNKSKPAGKAPGTAVQGLPLFECDSSMIDSASEMLREVSRYRLEAQNVSLKVDPLVWWKDNEQNFPHVGKVARIVLSISASEIENERDFSIAGVFSRARRASMSVANIAQLTFINKNSSASEGIVDDLPPSCFDGCEIDDSVDDEIEEFLEPECEEL